MTLGRPSLLYEGFRQSMINLDCCIDSNALSVTIEFYLKAIKDAMARGVTFRSVTEIIRNNLPFCKEMMRVGIELRHLDKVKGNFSVFDNKVYLATVIVKESQPIPQVIVAMSQAGAVIFPAIELLEMATGFGDRRLFRDRTVDTSDNNILKHSPKYREYFRPRLILIITRFPTDSFVVTSI